MKQAAEQWEFVPTFQQRLDRVGIDDEGLLTILEAGWWALNKAVNEVGRHLDLNNECLAELAEKSTKLQNDCEFWDEVIADTIAKAEGRTE